nr:hypothetical protein BJQ95_00607 [Cryobacterium sp. SO1]
MPSFEPSSTCGPFSWPRWPPSSLGRSGSGRRPSFRSGGSSWARGRRRNRVRPATWRWSSERHSSPRSCRPSRWPPSSTPALLRVRARARAARESLGGQSRGRTPVGRAWATRVTDAQFRNQPEAGPVPAIASPGGGTRGAGSDGSRQVQVTLPGWSRGRRAKRGLLDQSSGAVPGAPHSHLMPQVELSGAHQRTVQAEPLPVPVEFAVEFEPIGPHRPVRETVETRNRNADARSGHGGRRG